jgi:fructose-1,6-bisphosphatase I
MNERMYMYRMDSAIAYACILFITSICVCKVAGLIRSPIQVVSKASCRSRYALQARVTLKQYLNSDEQVAQASEEIKSVLLSFAACSIEIAGVLASAAITGSIGSVDKDESNPSGDIQKKLDVISNDLVKAALRVSGVVGALASEEDAEIEVLSSSSRSIFVTFDPLDGSSNIDCASPTGTIFGIYAPLKDGRLLVEARGHMVAAGYILYSSSIEYVLSCGNNITSGFTYDPQLKEFVLTRRSIRVPPYGPFYSLNEGRSADWPLGLIRYIDDIKNGRGVREGVRYSSRYVCSLVADVHRTLLYGGWAGNPRSHLRLLFEAAPLAFVMNHAGGAGTDGLQDLLDVFPNDIHQRLPVFLGSLEDINELKSYGDVQQTRGGKY